MNEGGCLAQCNELRQPAALGQFSAVGVEGLYGILKLAVRGLPALQGSSVVLLRESAPVEMWLLNLEIV